MADVVVSEEDAVRIFAADIKASVLKEARVVLVVN
jgi:chemotaxis methyl-accepting protein methylase